MTTLEPLGRREHIPAATCSKECHGSSSFVNNRNSTKATVLSWGFTESTHSFAADHVDVGQQGHQILVDLVPSCRKSSFRNLHGKRLQVADQEDIAIAKKTVHFDETFEESCFFLSADAPRALTSEPASTRNEKDAIVPTLKCDSVISRQKRFCLLNSPFDSPSTLQPVLLESVEFSPTGKQIKGTVKVLNLGFQKDVAARFTFDDWKTVSEVSAEHEQSLYLGHSIVSDRFVFLIDSKNIPLQLGNMIHVCIRYNVLDREYWDNNGGTDYSVTLPI
ncbi:CAZyme family CBM21 [Aspergillus niger]|nr:CAZyme family CBM21 [Aspergillus niger]KAI3187538.1 CAZyme family CBM21 [Penicillium roqueforti]GLA78797.1 hypothetical protein AtubIFM55763_000689 [Aspergillus tubingensis]KAI2891923.1 CAZyme family CBM21 [Aspergillus niger]KAI2893144.1 CAZyme family CBM21 [Aspergillus niger]